jgi:hypothetical protein
VWIPCCQDEELQLGFEGQEEDDHVSCLFGQRRVPLTTVFLPVFSSIPLSSLISLSAPLSTSSGTGRMSHLKDVNRRFKNGFREGGHATKKTKTESA